MPDTYPAILTYMYDQASTDFALDIATIEDTFEKAIARYEYPFRNGADLEDLGQKAHCIRFRCYFWEETYDLHKTLLNDLNTLDGDGWKLTHPEYGAMRGKIQAVSANYDDRERTAEIDITFIEQMRGRIEPAPASSVDQDSEGAFADGIAELEDEFSYDVKGLLGAEGEGILGKDLDITQGLFGQFTGLSKAARTYVKGADAYVKTLKRRVERDRKSR